MRPLIQYLTMFLQGKSFQELFTSKVAQELGDKWTTMVQDATGIPKEYVPIFAGGLHPGLRSWITAGEKQRAKMLVEGSLLTGEGVIEDLTDALDAAAILEGGTVTAASGEKVRVTFKDQSMTPGTGDPCELRNVHFRRKMRVRLFPIGCRHRCRRDWK